MAIDGNFLYQDKPVTVFFGKKYFPTIALVFASSVIGMGLAVLAGWAFDINWLKRPIPHLVAMNPLTALSFVLSGSSLILLTRSENNSLTHKLGLFIAILVGITSLAQLLSTYFHTSWHLDRFIFNCKILKDNPRAVSNGMAASTALGFLLTAVALLLLSTKRKAGWWFSHKLSLIIILIGLFSLLGYGYQVPEFFDLLRHLPMAIHTAMGLIVLSLSILFVHPDRGITKELTSNLAGSQIAGRLLLSAILIPIILGSIRIFTHLTDNYSTTLVLNLMVLAIVTIFSVLSLYFITVLNKKDLLQQKIVTQFRLLVEAAPEAVFIVDNSGKIQLVNARAEKVFNYSRHDILGKNLNQFVADDITDLLSTNTLDDSFGIESTGIQKNGVAFPVDVSMAKITMDEAPFISVAIRDITERKQAEKSLQESQEIFRSLVTSIRDVAIFRLDLEGRILTWNAGAANIKGYRENEILGQSFSVFYPPEAIAINKPNYMLEMARLHGQYEEEGWRVKKDGTRFWADAIITALFDTKGQLNGYAKVTRDITENKKSRDILSGFNRELTRQVAEKTALLEETTAQLRQLSSFLQTSREEERKYLAREMHDQLGQMLTAIRMDITWLKKNIHGNTSSVETRFEGALELLTETRQIMQRISRELHPAMLEDLGLSTALSSYIREFEKRSGITIHTDLDITGLNELNLAQDITIGIYRVLQESLTNIAKHANASIVDISLYAADGNLELCIQDNGVGFNVSEVAAKKTLGLVSIRERALMMQGFYTLDSKIGQGTTAVLTIPIRLKQP